MSDDRSHRTEAPEGSRQIRVLYCILDNRVGGPHRLAETVARRLRRYGVETLFLVGQKTTEVWRPDGFESFPCKHIQCFTRRRPVLNFVRFCCLLPCNLFKIRRLLRRRDIGIVHVDGVTNFVPALAARWAGVPIVWLYNDHLPGPLQRMLLPLVTRLSSTVLVQGKGLREARTAGDSRLHAKTCVLYSAVDTEKLVPPDGDKARRDRIRADLGVPTDCILIGAVGNLNQFKGYTYFLEAAARVKKQVAQARFLVVGRQLDTDTAHWDHLQQLTARLGLQDSVVFAGFREDVPRVLSALDVFVLSSILESCPVALLEAMAMKVPVVATRVGAVEEMVDHEQTGLLVAPRDPEAIANAVLGILNGPPEQVRNMVEQARKTVEERFAVDTIAKEQWRVYEKICANPVRHLP